MFHDTATTIARLEAIRALGVRIAIDDFGTGYSSLGYLRRFRGRHPQDRPRVRGARRPTPDEWAFAGAIVALGRTLGLTIVAEGIEEPGQLERLRALGCELGQGYLFARPSDADVDVCVPRRRRRAPASQGDRADRRPRPTARRSPDRRRSGVVPEPAPAETRCSSSTRSSSASSSGFLARRTAAGLADLRFRWPWVIVVGLVVQLLLFSDAADRSRRRRSAR